MDEELGQWTRYFIMAGVGLVLGLLFLHFFPFLNSTAFFASTTVRPAYLDAQPQAAAAVPAAKPAPAPAPRTAAAPLVVDACATAGMLYRSLFTSGVTDREPNDHLEQLAMGTQKVFFYTEVIGSAGQLVTHVWYHDGTEVARVPFNVKGDRWRTWSSKNLDGKGDWSVKVLDESGCVLGTQSINVATTTIVDPKDYVGWLRPRAAFMNFLATRQLKEKGAPNLAQTQLESAIQAQDAQAIQQRLTVANLYARDKDGLTALDFTHRLNSRYPGQYKAIEDQLRAYVLQHPPVTANDVELDDFGQIAVQIGPALDWKGESLLTAAIRYNDPQIISRLLSSIDSNTISDDMLYSWDASGKNMSDLAHSLDHETVATFVDAAMKSHVPPWGLGSLNWAGKLIKCDAAACGNEAVAPGSAILITATLVGIAGRSVALVAHRQAGNTDNGATQTVNLLSVDATKDVQTVSAAFPVSNLSPGTWQIDFEDAQTKTPFAGACDLTVADPGVAKGAVESGGNSCRSLNQDLVALVRDDAPVRLVDQLMQNGASINEDSDGVLITSAVRSGNVALVRYLLSRGVPIDATLQAEPGAGKTALVFATERGNWGMAHYLIANGADVNFTVSNGQNTPLHFAVQANALAIARDLIEAGAKPNAVNGAGQTPLYAAAGLCERGMVELLLQAGADARYTNTASDAVTPQTPNGVSTINMANSCRDPSLRQMLAAAAQTVPANQAPARPGAPR